MAGMLPGVEAARIRRIHQNNLNNGGSARRSSFSLYATNYQEFHVTSSPSSKVLIITLKLKLKLIFYVFWQIIELDLLMILGNR